MESVGVFLNEELDSLSRMFSTDQEADFALQFIGHDLFPTTFSINDEAANYNTNMAAGIDHESILYINSSDTLDTTNFFYFSQESSNSSGSNNSSSFPTPAHENHHYFSDSNLLPLVQPNNMSESMDFSVMDDNNHNNALLAHVFSTDHLMEDSLLYLKEEMGNNGNMENSITLQEAINDQTKEAQLKRKFEQPEPPEDDKINVESSENPKKKPRVSREVSSILLRVLFFFFRMSRVKSRSPTLEFGFKLS